MLRDYLKLMRVKHYIKNLIIFIPIFFAGELFSISKITTAIIGLISFCFITSFIYIINDYKDIENDKNHPSKSNRPLASGRISPKVGLYIAAMCFFIGIALILYLKSIKGFVCILLYVIINIAYSFGFKNVPVLDVVILASGFVIRIFFGGFITGITISKYLYLVVVTGSLYMGLGKRRNELKRQTESRKVLKYYNFSFLDKNMYVCVALADVFYALWSMEMRIQGMIWTVPFFMVILMCYSLDTEDDSDGDPIEVILQNKSLIILIAIYALVVFGLLYIS